MRKKTTSGARSTKGNDKDCAQPSSTTMTIFLSLLWMGVAFDIADTILNATKQFDIMEVMPSFLDLLLAVAITCRRNWARLTYVIRTGFLFFVIVVAKMGDSDIGLNYLNYLEISVAIVCGILALSNEVASAFVSRDNDNANSARASTDLWQCILYWIFFVALWAAGSGLLEGLLEGASAQQGSDGASESSAQQDDGNDSELEEKLRMLFGSDDDDDAEEGETEYNAKIHPPIIAIPSYRRDENLNRRISFEVANMDTGKSILVRAKAVGHDVTREIVIPPGGKETIDNLKWIGSHEMEDVVFILSVPGYEYVLVIRYKTGTDRYTSRYEKRKSI
ncbi:MAG: hypothetical protein IJH50_00935 [Kiritimatiellae bacterium]|nr:hypothetical protein [Kiritimatiellia bacterium]